MNEAVASWQDAIHVLRNHGIAVNVEANGFSGVLRHENAGVTAFDCGLDHLECEGENGSISLSLKVGQGQRVARVFLRSSSEKGLSQIVALLVDAARKVGSDEHGTWVDALEAANTAQGGESWNPDAS